MYLKFEDCMGAMRGDQPHRCSADEPGIGLGAGTQTVATPFPVTDLTMVSHLTPADAGLQTAYTHGDHIEGASDRACSIAAAPPTTSGGEDADENDTLSDGVVSERRWRNGGQDMLNGSEWKEAA